MELTATRAARPRRLRYAAVPAAISRVRGEVRAALEGSVPQETLRQVVLLVSELATNAVRHAGTPWFSVELDRRPGLLHVEVRDAGRGFDGERGERDPDREGGFGLLLVERVADAWGLEAASGTRVWFDVLL
jgi:anti-sigma regulatory factor (Ser/Thr protein kinase)